jgi:hypothetical protein
MKIHVKPVAHRAKDSSDEDEEDDFNPESIDAEDIHLPAK